MKYTNKTLFWILLTISSTVYPTITVSLMHMYLDEYDGGGNIWGYLTICLGFIGMVFLLIYFANFLSELYEGYIKFEYIIYNPFKEKPFELNEDWEYWQDWQEFLKEQQSEYS